MKKVEDKQKYKYLFKEYKHNIPVIYSHLDGQYDCELYVDDVIEPSAAMLFTYFDFHYAAGDAENENIVEILDEMIFGNYLKSKDLKEGIVFTPNEKLDAVLNTVFKKHKGIKDERKIFKLNKDSYIRMKEKHKGIQAIDKRMEYICDRNAKSEYPECRIYDNGKCVSFCSGFMLGGGHAEIDVSTDEEYRGRGYAKEAAIGLIDELIKNNIEPDWCTWSFRKASQKLALSLGYELEDVITAHIWVEEECGTL